MIPEFINLLKEIENQQCFDCGKSPAQWASINNAIYLCIKCSGIHRGYGVDISYIRSITLDTWNENQINLMKMGGNKNLRIFLEKYDINKNNVDKNILYHSKIMDFYRKYLKNISKNLPIKELAPSKEEALKSLNNNINNNNNANKFISIGSKNENDDNSLKNYFGKRMNNNIEETKGNEKKEIDMNITEKITNTSKSILDKGIEFFKSENIKNLAKNTNETINYYINWFFGNQKEETKDNEENKDEKKNENEKEKKNEDEKESNLFKIN